jgi:hypothetical protein
MQILRGGRIPPQQGRGSSLCQHTGIKAACHRPAASKAACRVCVKVDESRMMVLPPRSRTTASGGTSMTPTCSMQYAQQRCSFQTTSGPVTIRAWISAESAAYYHEGRTGSVGRHCGNQREEPQPEETVGLFATNGSL